MLGTPIRLPAARDLYSAGLKIVSTDRYGKADSTDRLGHAPAGIAHAKRGWSRTPQPAARWAHRCTSRSMTTRRMTGTNSC